MKSFYDLNDTARFAIYGGCEALQCHPVGGDSSGKFTVAVARGKFGELCQFMKSKGFAFLDMYYFPLGSDKPPMELRHDSARHDAQNCNWLYANFTIQQ